MRRIILAVDDSEFATDIIQSIKKLDLSQQTELKLLTVLEPLDDINGNGASTKYRALLIDINEKRKEYARRCMEKVRAELSEKLDNRVHFEIREGNPEAEILDAAVEWSADKIYLGARGKGSKNEHIGQSLGSISRTVATHSPCSVEIIRPELN